MQGTQQGQVMECLFLFGDFLLFGASLRLTPSGLSRKIAPAILWAYKRKLLVASVSGYEKEYEPVRM
ncbi:MAG: hypothetical protein GY934_11175 [Gammaproteobacteria bacterium]|nr:hypothetical protein [Gammaproteobacteria bacterium]